MTQWVKTHEGSLVNMADASFVYALADVNGTQVVAQSYRGEKAATLGVLGVYGNKAEAQSAIDTLLESLEAGRPRVPERKQ